MTVRKLIEHLLSIQGQEMTVALQNGEEVEHIQIKFGREAAPHTVRLCDGAEPVPEERVV